MSLTELADRVQVSPSFLSQIENGKNQPSLSTLKKIANCLGVSVSRLLGEEEHSTQMLVRANERNRLSNLGDGGLAVEFMSAFDPQNVMEVCMHDLAPGAKSGVVAYSHEGQEVFVAIKGSIRLCVNGVIYPMEEGDCFYLKDCCLPHLFSNASESEEAKMLCITTPPFFYSGQKTRNGLDCKNT